MIEELDGQAGASLLPKAIAAVQEMSQGGAESALECVGSESAMATANSFAEKATAVPVRVERLPEGELASQTGYVVCHMAVVTISI
jgi:hypothetical protein